MAQPRAVKNVHDLAVSYVGIYPTDICTCKCISVCFCRRKRVVITLISIGMKLV